MSFHERTGHRDLAMSRWQRPASIRRYSDWRWPSLLTQIDIDSNQTCSFCMAPLALIEYQRSTRAPKLAPITERLAQAAGVPACSVSYSTDENDDISHVRWRELWPTRTRTVNMTPQQYADWLHDLRRSHYPDCPAPAVTKLDWIWEEPGVA